MAEHSVKWSRLVRYENDSGSAKYGEPIIGDSSSNDIAYLAREGKLTVHVCDGESALEAKPTSRVEKVERLLGPLVPQEVPIIRCIGLNYKSHSR